MTDLSIFLIVIIVFIAVAVLIMDSISRSLAKSKELGKKPEASNKSYVEATQDSVIKEHDQKKVSTYLPSHMKQAAAAEMTVDSALRQLQEARYFVFRDLIIPSASKSLNLTQIDHVLVSRMGIFCIETKSNNGNIYGFTRNEHWKQYLGNSGKPFEINSPFRQNRHHVASLEILLQDVLRAPIHSYIAFPNAKKVVVDSKIEDMTPHGVVSKIIRHDRVVYGLEDVERIAKTLAHAATFREQLRDRHIDQVKSFLDAKVSQTTRLS